MKWLILLALVASCGKHTEPAAVDLKDSDGDQVQNYKETEFDKYVANFEKLTEVKGTLRFLNDRPVEIGFSNKHDLNSRTVKMITGNENQVQPEAYFSEWSKVSLSRNEEMNLTQALYQLKLDFVTGSGQPNEVLLINGKNILKLGKWEQNMKLTISKEDLKDLISGKAEIVLVKEFENKMAKGEDAHKTIKEKTYRVYFNDGDESQIFYVSKDLSYERFLEMMKVDIEEHINEDFLFFRGEGWNEKKWFDREFKNGDKVVVKHSLSHLREELLKRFTIQTKTIGRVNGQANESLNFMNKENAKIYLKIKSFSKTVRSFADSSEVRGGGGGGREGNSNGRCTIYRRNVTGEELRYLPSIVLEEELGSELFNINFIHGDRDEKGNDFWKMKLEAPTPNFILKFKSYAAKTYVQTGEIGSNCGNVVYPQNTHPEGKLSLELESYVEKIE